MYTMSYPVPVVFQVNFGGLHIRGRHAANRGEVFTARHASDLKSYPFSNFVRIVKDGTMIEDTVTRQNVKMISVVSGDIDALLAAKRPRPDADDDDIEVKKGERTEVKKEETE